jgi:N-ethylmaleimide reductase
MTRGRADNEGNVPTDDLHGLYEQRASAGLIITEGAQVSLAIGYINTAGITQMSKKVGKSNQTCA